MSVRFVDNPARDVASLDITREHVDRAETAVRRAGIEAQPFSRIDHTAADGSRRSLFVVFESMQATGSFKVRGAVAFLAAHADEVRARGVIAASAGNHGAGVAWQSHRQRTSATIVVPHGTPAIKRDKIESYGARLVLHGTGYDDAEAHARALATSTGALFVSAYDDVDIAAGNGGTLARDVLRTIGSNVDAVLVPVGGGGLASGFAAAAGPRVRVYGAQSEACPAMAESIERGAAIESMRARGSTFAEGLEGGVSKGAFDRARRALSGVYVVDEADIGRRIAFARDRWGVLIEGSSAVALGAALQVDWIGEVGVVVLTGRNVD
ncbi:MAG: threonine/serine dehydratase [Polyangiales bacterium]